MDFNELPRAHYGAILADSLIQLHDRPDRPIGEIVDPDGGINDEHGPSFRRDHRPK